VIINATGVFSDSIIQMDKPEANPMIRPSQGVHVVLEKEFLDGPHAIMIPHTTDGRVLFAVPWLNHVVLGTTDTPIDKTLDEPIPKDEEIDFILANAGQYMTKKPKRKDVKSVFAGLRPLAANQGSDTMTKEISRHHKINVSTSGLISLLGGKWTTYRKIAEDAINTASIVGGLKDVKCRTHKLKLTGYYENIDFDHPLHAYGSDASTITANGEAKDNESLSSKFYITKNLILWSIQKEMAIHLDDILARRIRCLFLDAEETKKIAPIVAKIMAEYLNKNESWINKELSNANKIIKNYIL
jgi:glycerol-3-phosphate dehydrogenase